MSEFYMQLIYIFVVSIIGLFAVWKGVKTSQKKMNRSKIPGSVLKWSEDVKTASREFNVPFDIALSVLWQESGGRPEAVGSANEKGLMQLKPIAVKDLQLEKFGSFTGWERKPKQNIRAGTAFLALQKKEQEIGNRQLKLITKAKRVQLTTLN